LQEYVQEGGGPAMQENVVTVPPVGQRMGMGSMPPKSAQTLLQRVVVPPVWQKGAQ